MMALAISPAEVIGLAVFCSVCSGVATWAVTRWRAEGRMDDALDADTTAAMAADDPPVGLMTTTLADGSLIVLPAFRLYDQDAEPSFCCFACPSTDTTLTAFGIPTCADHAPEAQPC